MEYRNLDNSNKRQCSFMSWVFIALAMVATGVTTYFVTESTHSNGKTFRNNIRFKPAESYETSILFHIPYLNFTEVNYDTMRISVYILKIDNISLHTVLYDNMICIFFSFFPIYILASSHQCKGRTINAFILLWWYGYLFVEC